MILITTNAKNEDLSVDVVEVDKQMRIIRELEDGVDFEVRSNKPYKYLIIVKRGTAQEIVDVDPFENNEFQRLAYGEDYEIKEE